MKPVKTCLATALLLLTTVASAGNAGNAADSDRDGVPDVNDLCPNNSFEELSRGVNPQGCPLHSDADRIPDYRDQCPDTPRGVRVTSTGCPIDVKLNVDNHIFNSRSLFNIH
jgi:OOP family OmpA-OmpF porin